MILNRYVNKNNKNIIHKTLKGSSTYYVTLIWQIFKTPPPSCNISVMQLICSSKHSPHPSEPDIIYGWPLTHLIIKQKLYIKFLSGNLYMIIILMQVEHYGIGTSMSITLCVAFIYYCTFTHRAFHINILTHLYIEHFHIGISSHSYIDIFHIRL